MVKPLIVVAVVPTQTKFHQLDDIDPLDQLQPHLQLLEANTVAVHIINERLCHSCTIWSMSPETGNTEKRAISYTLNTPLQKTLKQRQCREGDI